MPDENFGKIDAHIRIDILKVNQLIFGKYPVGSKERNELIRHKKLGELAQVNDALKQMPKESVEIANALNKHEMIFCLLRAAAYVTGLILVLPFLWRHVPNDMGYVALSMAAVLVATEAVKNLVDAYLTYVDIRRMNDIYQNLRSKFDKLADEVNSLTAIRELPPAPPQE